MYMFEDNIQKIIREATSDSAGNRGAFIPPLQPGIRYFDKKTSGPFEIPVSKYKSPDLEYDSYDGKIERTKNQRKKEEGMAKKIFNKIKNNPSSTFSDEDGNVINQYPVKTKTIVPIKEWVHLDSINLNETSTAISAGSYNGPISIGLKKWKKSELDPFTEFVNTEFNHSEKQKTLKNNVKGYVGHWEKNKDGSYKLFNHDTHSINEDLAVWFGTKKKPKGSKQPKGPWVDICRKVDGKHPPCGRSNTDKGAYPKCRAAGVAGKMSDSEKRSACQQKRRAEKKDTQTGKGQKPIMTSHKKINEDMLRKFRITEREITKIVNKLLKEQPEPDKKISLFCQNDRLDTSFYEYNLTYHSSEDMKGGPNNGGFKRIYLIPDKSIPRETYNTSKFILDATPIENVSPDFLNQTELDNSGDSILFFSYKSQATYFCTPIRDTDQEWITYLNSI
jgi:hypothetical protein